MLSVIIIDNKIFDHYSKYDYFFGHFENNKDVAVCVWNKQSIEDEVSSMVPQLMDAIRNVPEWNAYVICEPHNSIDYLLNDFKNKTQYSINPYERANHPDYSQEEDRLLRLLYYLGGRGDDRADYIQQYQFRAARPSNIYLITPRLLKNIEQQKFFLLSDLRRDYLGVLDDPQRVLAGEIDITKGYSEFWERYEYPPNCRFLVYDFPEEEHQTYQDCWFPFWISVISMTQNRFTNAVLAPYKLHMLNVDINNNKFEEYINKFYTMLLEHKEFTKITLEQEERLEREEATRTDITICDVATPVYVNFPHFDTEDLFATSDHITIYKDKQVLDEENWMHQMIRTRDAIGRFFKAIARGKDEAITFVHDAFSDELPHLKGKFITKYDAEELTESTEQSELNMLRLDLGYKASRARFEKEQRKADKIVQTYLRRRMKMKVSVGLIIAAMILYFVGFVPYLINSIAHNVTSFLIALPISIGAIAVPAIAGFLALASLRNKTKQLITLYNNTISGCYETVQKGAEIQGEYLTYLFDYMKKYQLLINSKTNNTHSLKINELLIANAVFDSAIAECAALATIRNVNLHRITDRYVENIIDPTPEARIYLYEDNPDGKMALNATPDALDAPFSFTDQLTLTTEELYECGNYTQQKEETA